MLQGRLRARMPWFRLLFSTALLAGTAWFVQREHTAGHLRQVDELYLDLLVSNARGKLKPAPPAANKHPVVLVTLKETEKAEYGAWPPPPLDWRTLLNSLEPRRPRVLVVAAPWAWPGRVEPEFLPALAEALLPFPSVVLSAEARLAPADSVAPASMGGLEAVLPRFQQLRGSAATVPAISAVVAAPAAPLRAGAELGLMAAMENRPGSPTRLPYLLRDPGSGALLPGLPAQALARYSQTPYAALQVRLGPAAGAFLGQSWFVPLQPDASLPPPASPPVPELNALELMTGALKDTLAPEKQALLDEAEILVLGVEPAGQAAGQAAPYPAALLARGLADALAMPRLTTLGMLGQNIVAGVAGALALLLAQAASRRLYLALGAGGLAAGFLTGLFAFEDTLTWCPPAVPLALLGVGLLLGLLPRPHLRASTAHPGSKVTAPAEPA